MFSRFALRIVFPVYAAFSDTKVISWSIGHELLSSPIFDQAPIGLVVQLRPT
jgi:hypothetical protein